MGMFDETSLPAAYFLSASNAAHAAFTGLFSLRRVHHRGAQKPVPEIARRFHVDAVIEGTTALRSGDRVRITALSIKALPEAHVWTETYERELRDVTMLQDDVALQIANEIRVKLTPGKSILV